MTALPEKLLASLEAIEGFSKENFIQAHQDPPVTSIRLHPQKKPEETMGYTSSIPWCTKGYYLDKRPIFTLDPLFHAGAYYVQEASSMFLEQVFRQVVHANDNLRVLDVCAAPGGKSTHLASLLSEESLLVSNEVIKTRAGILEENKIRWGYANHWVSSNDPKDFSELKGYFDIIVIDAPCSGSGLFRKDKKALEEWSPGLVNLCAARQKRIIADVWDALKEDGIVIYATCSYSPEENEQILDWIGNHFSIETIPINIQKEWGMVETHSPIHALKAYRFFPDKVQGEGFFMAALRKRETVKPIKLSKQSTINLPPAYKQMTGYLKEKDWHIIENENIYTAFLSCFIQDYHLLKQHLYIKNVGVSIGQLSKNELIPEHSLALSIEKKERFDILEVNKEEAWLFLKKENISFPGFDKGWYIVSCKGLSLGWVKHLGNRVNNYLPKSWRIRMELPKEDWA